MSLKKRMAEAVLPIQNVAEDDGGGNMARKPNDVKQQELFRKQERLEKAEKKLMAADGDVIREGARKLGTKRDELLQEAIEMENQIALLEKQKADAGEKLEALAAQRMEVDKQLKQRLTKVVICEKMIENFGRIEPAGKQ